MRVVSSRGAAPDVSSPMQRAGTTARSRSPPLLLCSGWPLVLGPLSSASSSAWSTTCAFLGRLSFHYDASQHTPPGPWGPAIVLAPPLGADRRRLSREDVRPRGEGTWGPGGDGRRLLRQGRHPARGCRRQVRRVGHLDRERRFGRARGPDRARSAPPSPPGSEGSSACLDGSGRRWSPRAEVPASRRRSTRR